MGSRRSGDEGELWVRLFCFSQKEEAQRKPMCQLRVLGGAAIRAAHWARCARVSQEPPRRVRMGASEGEGDVA